MLKRKFGFVLVIIGILLLGTVGSIGAYFTSTDDSTNEFLIGDVNIKLTEPEYDAHPEQRKNVKPEDSFAKDPKVQNTGTNDAYVFVEVLVPIENVLTYSKNSNGTSSKVPASNTPLFTPGNTNSGWNLFSQNTVSVNLGSKTVIEDDGESHDEDVIKPFKQYVYAYVNSNGTLKKLSSNAYTPAVFSTMKYGQIVEGQGLDVGEQMIPINAYAIQTENITANDSKDKNVVWNIVKNQNEIDR